MRNNHGAIKLSVFPNCDKNIGLYSIAPYKVIALNLLCFILRRY